MRQVLRMQNGQNQQPILSEIQPQHEILHKNKVVVIIVKNKLYLAQLFPKWLSVEDNRF